MSNSKWKKPKAKASRPRKSKSSTIAYGSGNDVVFATVDPETGDVFELRKDPGSHDLPKGTKKIAPTQKLADGKMIETVIDANGLINKVIYNSAGKIISVRRGTIDRVPVVGKFTGKVTGLVEKGNQRLYDLATHLQEGTKERIRARRE